jgi:radical SAM superfamily enzyme YgiQ (UPF0313 family)
VRYEGPIYRPPSEADSLLIQATLGCPHNKCTFCMVYKQGPRYGVRPLADILEDLREARESYGPGVRTLFLPAGNTIAMPTDALCAVCQEASALFPALERITVYASSQYIVEKGAEDLRRLREAGLSRVHVGLESGDDEVLRRIKKGADKATQVQAGRLIKQAGIQLSLYVVLGIGGTDRTREHALETADVINRTKPEFTRLRTFVPKVGTPLLRSMEKGEFTLLPPHDVLRETALIIEHINVPTQLKSDHYTNYVNLDGLLPEAKEEMLREIDIFLERPEETFRPFFVGNQ